MSVNLTGNQVKQLAEFVYPDEDDEQLETLVSVQYFDTEATDKETGEKRPKGYYAWLSEYPEEGSIYLEP